MKPIHAKKSFGQNFLQDSNICRKIVDFARIGESDTVIEIGPGTGQLTDAILQTGATVYGVEIDTDLIPQLKDRFAAPANPVGARFHLVEADVLELDWNLLIPKKHSPRDVNDSSQQKQIKLLGNLPYNIATRILTRMAEERIGFQSFTFMVQKEVADRILAAPGSKDYGYLTLVLAHRFRREKGFDVAPGAFRPRPKVISHVMQISPYVEPQEEIDYPFFLRLIQTAFRHRRKTLWNNLTGLGIEPDLLRQAFESLRIAPKARAEEISLEVYRSLTRVLSFTP
ncbi:MAG: ribosomal RNA small subunit methyltransferase A [Acidobacteriota bacterium]|nr:MAG: ribosomal RNA small subunit methyltransferase A [Acidobacteriota bacterium]